MEPLANFPGALFQYNFYLWECYSRFFFLSISFLSASMYPQKPMTVIHLSWVGKNKVSLSSDTARLNIWSQTQMWAHAIHLLESGSCPMGSLAQFCSSQSEGFTDTVWELSCTTLWLISHIVQTGPAKKCKPTQTCLSSVYSVVLNMNRGQVRFLPQNTKRI